MLIISNALRDKISHEMPHDLGTFLKQWVLTLQLFSCPPLACKNFQRNSAGHAEILIRCLDRSLDGEVDSGYCILDTG